MEALIFLNVSGALASAHEKLPRSFCALENVCALFALSKKAQDCIYFCNFDYNIRLSRAKYLRKTGFLSKYSEESTLF